MLIVCKFLKNLIFYHLDQKQDDMKQVKHHLYGTISVNQYFSAGDWLKQAKKILIFVIKNNKVPIIVGGTGLIF